MFRLSALAFILFPVAAIAQEPAATVTDPIDPSIFIGAPLLTNDEKYELTKAPRFQFQPTEFLVIGDGDVKPADGWTAEAIAACEASGGEVLPLPAGRKMCLRF